MKVFLVVAILIIVTGISAPLKAQTTKTVGTSGNYTTLKLAFDAINAGTITGNIQLQVITNTTETATAVLNANGSGSASYTSVVIYPTVTGLTITGNLAAPVINLNDADKVTIDGRVNKTGSTKSLTISNTNTGGGVLQFINDASRNAVRYCTILGVNATTTSGLIVFNTGAITGNDNDTIDNCDLGAGASTPTNMVYSAGSSVVIDNSGINISNCNIYNYFAAAAASNGIYVSSNSSAWTITGNKFYQTATRTVTTASTHHAININTPLGGNYSVTNNTVGHATSTGTGTTSYTSTLLSQYRGIELNVAPSGTSSVQGNIVSGISFTTLGGATSAPGIFTGISVLGGSVNIGTVTGNTIGATTGTGDITVTSSTTGDYLAGIYATSSANVSIQNNNVGSITNGTSTTMGYNFYGINTAGGGNFTISGNTIGSTTTPNSIGAGTTTTTSGICTFNGIANAATGVIAITGNTMQNCTAYGTGASVFNGIANTGGVGTLNITANNVIAAANTGSGTLTGIANAAAVGTLNMNGNIVRGISKTVGTGAVTALSNTGTVTTLINMNNNQMGNASGDLVTYTVANSGALTGISNTGGAATAALFMRGNDIRGVTHSVGGSSVHTYLVNSASTLSQYINSNTFTNLTVNTTGGVTFITVSNGLYPAGTQAVDSNAIVTAFSKTGVGGTVTFCSASGNSQPGSVVHHNQNNFSNVTVTGATAISGWINSNASLNKTFSTNTFNNWTGGSAALTVMTITGGASTITGNTISNMTTGTAAAAPIIAISSGATGAIAITNNTISGLVSGSAASVNSFTGITNNAGTDVTITGNTVTGCTAGGTGISLFKGIETITAGSGALTVTGNNIISGTNAGVGATAAFTAIGNSATFATANISNNVIRSNSITSAAGMFTAISNTGAVTNAITISNNQLGNATGGLVNYTVANSGTLTGISNTGGTVACALTIQGNDIRGITYGVAGTHAQNYILNSAGTLSQNISSNTFTNLSVNTSGAITFITDNVTMPTNGVQNVNSNSIVTAFVRTAAAGALTLFTSTTATNNANVTVNNNANNFSNITINGAATIAGWVNTDAGAGGVTKTIDGNTFANWTAGTGTGTITALNVNVTSPNNATRNNNVNTISSAGIIYGITTAAGNDSIYNNNINTLTSTGGTTTVVNGIAVTAGTNKSVFRNTIYNLTANTITNGSLSGIAVSGGVNNNVYQNTLYGLTANVITTGSVNGIAVSAGAANNVYRNKIYTIASAGAAITTGTVNGILVSGATTDQTNTLYNNKIGDIRATAASVTSPASPVNGISVTNTGVRSATNAYFNTVYLNATSTGTNFATSGVYHTVSTLATTAALDLRNNIIVDLSTSKGTGVNAAFRRSSGAAVTDLVNYATTSNNNLFYAGTPSVTHLIYSDGTSTAQTLAAYKTGVFTAGTIAPRDQASVTESPTFVSTTGSSTDFLKINTSTATQIESGAVNVPSITNDFDGNVRQGNSGYAGSSTTAPDLGASEGNYILSDNVGPSISYTLIPNTTCTASPSLSAVITDASGVNITSGTKPRLYYKRSTDGTTYNDNTSGTAGWKWVESTSTTSPFSFTPNFALLSGGTGVTYGNTVQYFVVAQDLASTPKISINKGTFAVAPTSVALTSTAFPISGTLNSYSILTGLSGAVTIGATGKTYTTLTGAGGLFSAINTYGLKGNLNVTIMDASITENGANSLNAISYGCDGNYTVTIKPNAALAATLTGTVGGPLINLNGADNVTIDGLNTGGGTLTIQNLSTAANASTISMMGDATNNTITNCTISGSGTASTTGVILFSSGLTTGNDGNTISNDNIQPAGSNLPLNAICSIGSSVNVDNSGINISNCNIYDFFNGAAASNGIYVSSNSSAWTITGNKFYQTATRTVTTASTHHAININTPLGGNYSVTNNTVGHATSTGTGTTSYTSTLLSQYRGIELNVAPSGTSSVQGNIVSGISFTTLGGATSAPGIFTGISVLGGSVNIGTVTGNTIGATTGTGDITVTSSTTGDYLAGIYATSSANVSIQNNNVGSITNGTSTTMGYNFYGINTAGGGNFTISGNTIGSTTTPNSIGAGTTTTTSGICTFNGIANAATGVIAITGNTMQNCTAYGTGASVFNGIANTGGVGTLNITANNVIAAANTGSGTLTGIANAAAVGTLNMNGNIVRGISKTVGTGAVTALSNTGTVTTLINMNNNQMGNASGDLVTYTVANSGALTGISNTGGAATAALFMRGNDIRGVTHSVGGSSVHTYLVNSASTLSQYINSNTFTNLTVNTTGGVTFITVSNGLYPAGTQAVDSNAIVTAFSKTGVGGTVTFCSASGNSQPGSVVHHNQNNFSNVTVTGATAISGWINSNASLNKTFSTNTFNNWTGGSAALTVMTITGGASTITGNTISNMTTGTAAAAPIIAISSGATGAIAITNNTISGLVSGSAASVNSFTGITNNAGTDVTITGNTVTGCTAGGTGISLFKGIETITAGSGALTVTGNNIISGTNAGVGATAAFTAIGNSATFATANISNNVIRSNSITSAAGMFTAISNTGAVTNAITISNNQLGNATGGLVNYTVANSGTLTGISNTGGTVACALTIQGNDIRGITYGVAGTHAQNYILNSAGTLSQNISSNTFTNLSVNTSGAITFITDNVTMPTNGVQNVNSNSIVTAFVRTAAAGALTLFTSTTATNNANVTVNNNANNFSNITINGAATIAGWVNTDAGAGGVTKTIDGNTFANWTAGTGTGTITALNVNVTSPNNATRNNNVNTISSAGIIYGITTAAGNDSIYNNNINTLTSTGGTTTVVNGIAVTAGTNKSVFRNTIYNLTANTITNGSLSGIAVSGGVNNNVYQNTLYGLTANVITTGSVNGIAVSAGAANNVYRNKIYTIASAGAAITTGTVNGILVSGATTDQTNTLYNNKIGDIRATAASVTSPASPVNGISVTNTGVRSATNVYYNTVYLNATSTGTNFATSGVYHTANAIATTANLDLRNNVVVNLSTPKGTGVTVAFRRSAGTAGMLANYASTSNNNLFYSGYSSVITHLIYSDGTSTAQTLAAYKAGVFAAGTIAPRDQASITENPVFVSTTGSSTDFLKNSPTAVTFMESGATTIAGITTDFDGDIRFGNPGYPTQSNGFGTAPDIGADEFDGAKPNIIVINSNEVSDGYYANLGAAFGAINAQDQTGKTIGVTLLRSTIEPTTATLSPGAWTSLNVYPTLTNLAISGNLAAPLIDLNGADKVTIDGRVNQTGSTVSLSIDNSSTSATSGTSTIRFIQSAENNTVKYCTLNGSTMSTSDGVVLFSTASAGNGNDNNLIDNNLITNSGGNRPVNLLYSAGTSGYENNPNTVSNNAFYNFLNASASSNGIYIGANSTDWILTANSFYETTSFVPTSGTYTYTAINIDNTSGNNFTISGNFIGGQAISCGGSPWSVNAATNHSFSAINLNVGTSTPTSVQNNVIRNMSYRSASATPWKGIQVQAGTANIGTVTANVIGSNTGTGSLILTSTADAESNGIYLASTGTVSVSKNQIGSITLVGNNTNVSHSFYAIHKTAVAGTLTIGTNIIGSTATGNSINASSTATTSATPQHLAAIFSESTGTVNITSNTVSNLNNAYAGTLGSRTDGIFTTAGTSNISKNTIHNQNSASLGTNGAVIGIELNGTSATNTVAENVVYALSNSGTTFSGYVAGIYFTGNTGSNQLNTNFIRTLTVDAASTSASVYGIRLASGATTCDNNIISLGGNTATTIYGIYENGAATNDYSVYFNTIYIGGSLGSGITNKSYALYSNATTNSRDFRNNILSNTRSTTGGSNLHYALFLNYGTDTNLTLDHNDYYVPGTGGVIGYYNGSNKNALPIVATQDANSFNVNPSFSNAGGTNTIDYKLTAQLNGEIGLSVVLDFEMVARGTPPNLGAFEYYTNRWTGTVSSDFSNPLNWTSNSVPASGLPVVFDDTPLNDCILDMNRNIGNVTNTQSTYKFIVNGKQLTLNGGLFFYNGAQMDAKTASSTVIFAGTLPQTIPDGAFVDNTILNLTINNASGVTSEGDLTVTNVLNLLSSNPSSDSGCLDVLSPQVLTLGSLSSISGNGDVTGIVRRTSFTSGTDYTFNNQLTKVNFGATGTLPTEVSFKLTLGAAPTWKTTAVNRIYEFKQTGGSNCYADVYLNYLQSELNGNDETKLVFWNATGFPSPTATEWGYTQLETTNNWVSIKNIPINLWATAFGTKEFTLASTGNPSLLWNGSTSSAWDNANNWTPVSFPTRYASVNIPDAAGTTNDPTVPVSAEIRSLALQNGGILNVSTGTQLNMYATSMNGWSNAGGTFNPGNSTVVFRNTGVTISGTTNFNNIDILNGASLTPLAGSVLRIAGTLNNLGTLDATSNINTIEYNGTNQTVILPNGALPGYDGLTLSGSGTKTLPASNLNINGNLTLAGTAVVAPTNALTIQGDLTTSSGILFTAGSLTHHLMGDLINNGGTFNWAGSTLMLDGTAAQTLGGSATTTFNHLTLDNTNGVTLGMDETVAGTLGLTNGLINTDSYTLTMASTGSISGGSATSHINGKLAEVFNGTGSKLFPIGKDGNYRPLTILLTALTGSTTLTAEQFESTLPGTAPANTDLFGDRYWQISQTGGTGLSAYVTLDGTGWDRIGTPKIVKGNGVTNANYDVTLPAYINATAFTSFGNFALGESDIVWKGTSSTDWFTASNWSSNLIPTGAFNIDIPSSLSTYPVISGSSPAQDVDIQSSTALTLENGATLTLENGPVLTFESGANVTTGTASKVIVKSGSSYINLSTSTPTLEVRRALTGVSGWRMVAAPVSGSYSDMFKAPLVTQGFTNSSFPALQPNLLWWLESDGGTALQSWRTPSNLTDNLSAGRGYFHYVFGGAVRLNTDGFTTGLKYSDVLPTTMTVTGTEPYNGTGTFDYNLTYTTKSTSQTPSVGNDSTYYDLNSLDQGWNLIGNPTASTLDWDATGWTKNYIDNTIYVWDPSALSGNGDYLTWNGTTGTLGNGKIAPFQAFWIHATNDSTLSFNNSVKSRAPGTFLRNASMAETITLPLTLSYGNLHTTSFITFSQNGVTGPDHWDAYRLEPMSETWLSLYTLSTPGMVSPLVINNLPMPEDDMIDIPLYYDAHINNDVTSNCKLSWTLPENWPSNWKISLQDHLNELTIPMTDQTTYSLNGVIGDTISATNGRLPMPKKLVTSLAKASSLRSTTSLPPFSIVISKGSDIEYMAAKPQLLGNYPNPFNAETTIRFSLPKKANVHLELYSSEGVRVATLADGTYSAGITEIKWNAKSNPPGIYLIRFVTDKTVEIKKAIFIK